MPRMDENYDSDFETWKSEWDRIKLENGIFVGDAANV